MSRGRALLADQATAATIPRVTKITIMGRYVITRRPAGGGGGGTLRSRAVHILLGLVDVEEQVGHVAGGGGRVAPALESAPVALESGAAPSRARGSSVVPKSITRSGVVRGELNEATPIQITGADSKAVK